MDGREVATQAGDAAEEVRTEDFVRDLAEVGASPGGEPAGAPVAAVTAAAEVKVAAAQLNEYEQRLGHTSIRTPADGVVLTRSVEVGSMISSSLGYSSSVPQIVQIAS